MAGAAAVCAVPVPCSNRPTRTVKPAHFINTIQDTRDRVSLPWLQKRFHRGLPCPCGNIQASKDPRDPSWNQSPPDPFDEVLTRHAPWLRSGRRAPPSLPLCEAAESPPTFPEVPPSFPLFSSHCSQLHSSQLPAELGQCGSVRPSPGPYSLRKSSW